MRLLRSLVLLALAMPLAAQSPAAQARVVRDVDLRATPDGNIVATLQTGTTWRTGAARGGFTRTTVEGWVDASRFAGRRDSFPESIGGSGTLRIRAEPSLNGRILGVFVSGAGVRVLQRRGTWARVRRDGWVLTTALAAAATPPRATASSPSATTPVGAERDEATREVSRADRDVQPREGALVATGRLPLHLAPGAETIGALEAGIVLEPLARDRGWVRVRVGAWVAESLLAPADTAYRASLTAADLRLDPDGYRGRTVRWSVQVVGLQNADPLRRDLAPEEPYLLAMGPGAENAILYLAVPPSLLSQARALAPLERIVVTARVRAGRSEPTGAPVLDIISIVKQR